MSNTRPLYWKPLALALLATIAVAVISHYAFKDTPSITYANVIINKQGIGPYFIMFFGFSVTLCALTALRKQDFRPRLSYLFIIMSFMPLVFGVVGWLMGLDALSATYKASIAKATSAEEIANIELGRTDAVYVAFDPMWIALLFFATSFSVSFNHWAYTSGRHETTPPKPSSNLRPYYFKAWAAFFTIHTSLSLFIGLAGGMFVFVFYRLFYGSKAEPPQYILFLIGLLISATVSYPLFKWICKSMILPQTMKEDA